ncbi:Uncharacterised protein [Mycobacteroides abscessus subsp. abscessus]|nr:Uncharacterised protein [Mycobacteroides abscessus subsp. abscessus]SID99682.1 Uncharacterised protein [Mycobacteroides abscessus subsp. abscessus]SIG75100.1 Uncharacterised protein [Mycobacteroides abscessus subsp. abscessus]SKV46766.1 Uncharacterised protein [Mycobacteroides abscessus subsp. abscessus]SKZ06356.1 Uncharacterised protein [Mycobacteroides abscessus subsp. abscessus]
MWQEGLGAVDDAPEVDIDDALDVLELAGFQFAMEVDAGVVVDLVDRAEVLLDGVGVEQKGFALRDVEAIGSDITAKALDLAFGFGQALVVDIADGDLGARSCQLDGQCASDARTGTGHHGDFAAEALHGYSSRFTLSG